MPAPHLQRENLVHALRDVLKPRAVSATNLSTAPPLAVADLNSSIKDYSARLEQQPTVVVSDKYAMWRTDTLNFSINQIPDRAGELRHVGFEDEATQGFSSNYDTNGLEWELFSPQAQDQKIVEMYGEPAQDRV